MAAGRFRSLGPRHTRIDFLVSIDLGETKVPKNVSVQKREEGQILNVAVASMAVNDSLAAKKYIEEELAKKNSSL